MTGAPYTVGDGVAVNSFEGHVVSVEHNAPAPFGLVWCLRVQVARGTVDVRCDDNGRNHTVGMRVEPSSLVSA